MYNYNYIYMTAYITNNSYMQLLVNRYMKMKRKFVGSSKKKKRQGEGSRIDTKRKLLPDFNYVKYLE